MSENVAIEEIKLNGKIIFTIMPFVSVIVGPILFVLGGWTLLATSLFLSLSLARILYRAKGWWASFTAVIISALATVFAYPFMIAPNSEGDISKLMAFSILSIATPLTMGILHPNYPASIKAKASIAIILLGSVCIFLFTFFFLKRDFFVSFSAIPFFYFLYFFGINIGRIISRVTQIIVAMWPYIKSYAPASFGYFFVYVAMVLVFAGYYWASYSLVPGALNVAGNQQLRFLDFIYFSTVTSATVGFGDITPASQVMRALTTCQIILSAAWITMGFAAVVAFVQKTVAETPTQKNPDHV